MKQVEFSMGIEDGLIVLKLEGKKLVVEPDTADDMAATLIRFATEVRDGGKTQETAGGWPVGSA